LPSDVLHDNASETTPSSGSGDSGRLKRHCVSSHYDVPVVLGGSGHPSSGIPVVANGTLITPVGTNLAAPTSIPGHELPNGTNSRSFWGSSNPIESGA